MNTREISYGSRRFLHSVTTPKPLWGPGLTIPVADVVLWPTGVIIFIIILSVRNISVSMQLIAHTWFHMMTSSNEIFSALLALCVGNSQITGGFPHKGQRRGAWCFLWSVAEQTVEQTIETPVIWDATVVMRCRIERTLLIMIIMEMYLEILLTCCQLKICLS